MSSIRAEIEASILYVALKAVSAVMDEVTLKFSSDGLSVRALDMAEVSMVDLSVPRALFESYTINGGDAHAVTVRMSDLVGGGYNKKTGPFKRPKKRDMVVMEHDGGNKLSFTMKGEARASLTLSVPVLQGDVKDLPLPKVKLTESFTARTDAVASFLASAKGCADSVYIKPRLDGSVELLVKGEVSDASMVLSMQEGTLVESDLHEVKAAFDITRLISLMQRTFGDTAKLEYGKELPLRITYSLSPGDLFREAGQVVFYVAPRVGYDEEPEPKEPTVTAKEVGEAMAAEVVPKVEPVVEEKPPEPQIVSVVEQAKNIEPEQPIVQEAPDPLAAFKRKYRKPSPL